MVLSDAVIKDWCKIGILISKGYKEENVNPASYDCTLGSNYKIYADDSICLDPRKVNHMEEFPIPKSGIILNPGEFYLMVINEELNLEGNVCASVEGKSSLARLGLDIHVCGGFIDPGFKGSLVLEVKCQLPIILYRDMRICQIKFEQTTEVETPYGSVKGSKYMNQEGIQESLYHKNFKDENKS